MTRHRRTDPACVNYRPPRWSWCDRRSRGVACLRCMAQRRDAIAAQEAAANEKLDAALASMRVSRAQHGQVERPQLGAENA